MSTPSPPVEAPSNDAKLLIFLQDLESGEWKRYRPRGRSLLERVFRGSRPRPRFESAGLGHGRGSSP